MAQVTYLKLSNHFIIKNEKCDSYHSYVIPIQEDLIQLCDSSALWRALVFSYILQHHVNKVVKAQESSNNFLVALHDDVDAWAYAFVH